VNNTAKRGLSEKLPVLLFVLSLCFFSALYGMVSWNYKIFPYQLIRDGIAEYEDSVAPLINEYLFAEDEEPWSTTDQSRPPHLSRPRFPSSGTKIYDENATQPGVTLITGYWGSHQWKPGIRLIDITGKPLHHWQVDPFQIWPFHAPRFTYVHGSYLFPDGDVVFNVEYTGMARMDACGKVKWKLWVAGHKTISSDDERAKQFPGIRTPFGDETVLKVSPEGEILAEISLLEVLYNSEYRHLLWQYGGYRKHLNVLHVNDVEILGSDLAGDYPEFDKGDILVSVRDVNLIAILSPAGEIKWLSYGVFTRQHDPDFEKDGWIAVFDNRADTSDRGKYLGGSRIAAINPMTNKTRTLYPTTEQNPVFYSLAGGKHQLLDNGNRLITEAQAARILEVDPQGRTVWEWIAENYSKGWVAEVLEGTRYPITPQQISGWACSENVE